MLTFYLSASRLLRNTRSRLTPLSIITPFYSNLQIQFTWNWGYILNCELNPANPVYPVKNKKPDYLYPGNPAVLLQSRTRGFPSLDYSRFGFIKMILLPTEQTMSCQERGLHILRFFSMAIWGHILIIHLLSLFVLTPIAYFTRALESFFIVFWYFTRILEPLNP